MILETEWKSPEAARHWLDIRDESLRNLDDFCELSHAVSVACGWWHNPDGSKKQMNFGERIALMHSELSEALEGFRKSLPSDHLEEFSMVSEEFADILIRVFDTAGAMLMPLHAAYMAKTRYNLTREDHKPENRAKKGGKKF